MRKEMRGRGEARLSFSPEPCGIAALVHLFNLLSSGLNKKLMEVGGQEES